MYPLTSPKVCAYAHMCVYDLYVLVFTNACIYKNTHANMHALHLLHNRMCVLIFAFFYG
jgi:fumarate reductase subunit D